MGGLGTELGGGCGKGQTEPHIDLVSLIPHLPRSLQEAILAQVQRIVKGEVSVALKEQQAAVTSSIMQAMRSAAGTPVPAAHLDCQAQQAHILQLLQQGHLNQAFQQVSQALGPGRGQCLLTRLTFPIRLRVVWQQTFFWFSLPPGHFLCFSLCLDPGSLYFYLSPPCFVTTLLRNLF